MNRAQNHFALLSTVLLFMLASSSLYAQAWIAPTPAELSMTSFPQTPGAAAVYLNREEITDDEKHWTIVYMRIKVLTEKGKDLANVEIGHSSAVSEYTSSPVLMTSTINSIQGRTIHPDGTIIPFTGKPYDKLIQRTADLQVSAKVFTLPSVEVGSIIEYRYQVDRENFVAQPAWYVQSNFYTVKAHFLWKPTTLQVSMVGKNGTQLAGGIGWFPVLPKGATVKQSVVPAGARGEQYSFDLAVNDVPPIPREEFMLPVQGLSYRVVFYYSSATSAADFWKTEGGAWSAARNKFIGPGPGVTAAVQKLAASSDTSDQKLHKFYNAVMDLENTAFTRSRTSGENKVEVHHDIRTTDDVLTTGRGSPAQLNELFVAMARAAGMKAYVMALTSRDYSMFFQSYLSLGQLNDSIAIVNVDGKDRYFDPGQRFCEYGHLAWKHTMVSGIRQTDAREIAFASTPGEPYDASKTTRIGDLTIDRKGDVSGTMTLTFTGSPALEWRQLAARSDDANLRRRLKKNLEDMTGGLDAKVIGVDNIDDTAKPLTVHYEVKGPAATVTGKRLIVAGELFRVKANPTFAQPTRTTDVYFHYAQMSLDAVRFKFDPSMHIESTPEKTTFKYKTLASYTRSVDTTTNSFTYRRNLLVGAIVVPPADYPELNSFYTKFESDDQEPVVLELPANPESTTSAPTL